MTSAKWMETIARLHGDLRDSTTISAVRKMFRTKKHLTNREFQDIVHVLYIAFLRDKHDFQTFLSVMKALSKTYDEKDSEKDNSKDRDILSSPIGCLFRTVLISHPRVEKAALASRMPAIYKLLTATHARPYLAMRHIKNLCLRLGIKFAAEPSENAVRALQEGVQSSSFAMGTTVTIRALLPEEET